MNGGGGTQNPPPPAGEPFCTVSARALAAGATLTFSGRFQAGERVTAELTRVRDVRTGRADTVVNGRSWDLGTFPADIRGLVLGAAVIPARASSGVYDFTLIGSDDTPTYTARLTVVRPHSD